MGSASRNASISRSRVRVGAVLGPDGIREEGSDESRVSGPDGPRGEESEALGPDGSRGLGLNRSRGEGSVPGALGADRSGRRGVGRRERPTHRDGQVPTQRGERLGPYPGEHAVSGEARGEQESPDPGGDIVGHGPIVCPEERCAPGAVRPWIGAPRESTFESVPLWAGLAPATLLYGPRPSTRRARSRPSQSREQSPRRRRTRNRPIGGLVGAHQGVFLCAIRVPARDGRHTGDIVCPARGLGRPWSRQGDGVPRTGARRRGIHRPRLARQDHAGSGCPAPTRLSRARQASMPGPHAGARAHGHTLPPRSAPRRRSTSGASMTASPWSAARTPR